METPAWLENFVLQSLEAYYSRLPQPMPSTLQLARAQVIAHRGEHRRARENTLAAFARAHSVGAWGIEFDLQWTQNYQPVISHDPDTRRVFGSPHVIAEKSQTQLRGLQPEIPTLDEVLDSFARKTHLLIEIKTSRHVRPHMMQEILSHQLKDLEPGRHYHLICLDPEWLSAFDQFPPEALLPIATTNSVYLMEQVKKKRWGGLLAPYGLCPTRIVDGILHAGGIVGTGFVESQNVIKRELNRDVRWLFSNDPEDVVQTLNSLRATPGAEHSAHHKDQQNQ